MDTKDVAIVVLAAGNARRFGSDKLMADLDGMPLGVRAAAQLAQLDAAAHIAVCQPSAAITQHYLKLGYTIAENRHAELGLSGSLHLAVEAAAQTEAQALMILLADMPFVQTSHVAALIAGCDGEILASSDGIQSMPPAIFPRDRWSRLLDTEGDAGARHILLNASTLAAPIGSLRDIDTPDDLAASKAPPLGLDRST
ncbi:nucleotidyltransferase family protein [Sphingorhabdus sp.]|jgi:molybdenum cofactor cytidylyltransferase|uniref:nucleotidyltransferase family protein n=1 Tax=Sphingorhabdus sp. TaxID=1902408 RepID=UPI0037C85752